MTCSVLFWWWFLFPHQEPWAPFHLQTLYSTFTQGTGTAHSTATQQLTSSRRGVDSALTNDVNGRAAPSPSLLSVPGTPAAVLQKLSQKILAGDYIKMAELLPDTRRMEELHYQQSGTPGQCSGPMRPRKKPVTDILTWIECFTIMAVVVTARYQ